MCGRFTLVALGISLFLASPASSLGSIILGQVDTFQDGTLQDWFGGALNPNPPTNISTDGPAGSGDRFLRLQSNGGTAGGRLVALNSVQWSGNYSVAGVSAISMQLKNFGPTDLVMRLILIGLGGNFVTNEPIAVIAGGDWQTYDFSLEPTKLAGGTDLSQTLATVTELNFVHNPNPQNLRTDSPPIVAELGVDNITAVPEPSDAVLLSNFILCMFIAAAKTVSIHHFLALE